MLIPVGEAVAVPVTVIVLASEAGVCRGTLVRLESDEFRVVVTDREVPTGTRLIVAVHRTKLQGRVTGAEGDVRIVSRDPDPGGADDRAAPRVTGTIEVRWRIAGHEEAAWVAGGPDPGPFSALLAETDLSVSGLRAGLGPDPPPVGARLLLRLGLDADPPHHRALGVVRRIEPHDANPYVAIEFIEVPESTLDALSSYTLYHL